jgi:phosphoribosylaminoimidazolecarboxamide formyltransferase/IMP cyclohydrolase
VDALTGMPEAFGGRMKTLSYPIAAGLLFDRTRDEEEAHKLQIQPIDLVVCNLYPFGEYRAKGLPLPELIEYIDIGGPTMVRAGAKNFRHVAVLTSPSAYQPFLEELRAHGGGSTYETRKRLMREAYAHTATYDTEIAMHLEALDQVPSARMAETDARPLRYGENPHQRAHFFPRRGVKLEVLGGKELSYNNLVDLDAALAAVRGLPGATVAVVKHENPCGLASAATVREALALAWAGDPVSAFGSVIACSQPVTEADVAFFDLGSKEHRKFVEILAAPDFTPGAVAALSVSKNLRILKIDPGAAQQTHATRVLGIGVLTQDADNGLVEPLERVAGPDTGPADSALVRFGTLAARQVKSNAIALVRRVGESLQLLGMGAGQPNRLRSTELALAQARANLRRELGDGATDEALRDALGKVLLVSDAFFPFADGVELAAQAGIKAIIEPGGSIRDDEVKAACERHGVTLSFTGVRHFRH